MAEADSYRNQSIDLRSKSMDWFLHGIGLRHERVKTVFSLKTDFASHVFFSSIF